MSFLMFAARKANIVSELNIKNYELTLIQDENKAATQKVADAKEALAAQKNQTSIWAANLTQTTQNMALNAMVQQAGIDTSSQLDSKAIAQLQFATQYGAQAGNTLGTAVKSITDSIFDAQAKAELAQLTAKANSLEMKQKTLESQIQLLTNEKGNIEKSEEQAASSLAPKFGVA